MANKLYYSLLLACLCLYACNMNDKKTEPANPVVTVSDDQKKPVEVAPMVEDMKKPEEPKNEPMTEQEAIDFVDTWSNIYGTHTYDNYIKMYDRRNFIGIKRTTSGERNVYDYTGWCENKRNEFKKFKPSVSIFNVKVKNLNQNGVTKVRFMQTWYSTTSDYADEGEKELVLVKRNGEIYIQKEELLYSKPVEDYGD